MVNLPGRLMLAKARLIETAFVFASLVSLVRVGKLSLTRRPLQAHGKKRTGGGRVSVGPQSP